MSSILNDNDHYNDLVTRQVDQYKEIEVMHDLPPIYFYWVAKHVSEKCKLVTGHNDIIAFYADYFKRSLQESGSSFLVSVGAGDCSIEISIVKKMISEKASPFFFTCLELSPVLIAKARKRIEEEQLGDIMTVAEVDINKWTPEYSFAGVMAHHALHHFLELEQLFKLIRTNLAPKGRFLTCDMIGRNGHMRWPEALLLTRKIWDRLPKKYKYNNQYKKHDDYFENWDFSTEGFEGIRAQDILPLLIENFSFEVFYSYGNLIDPFVDRGFGPNYDPANELDTAFIDYAQDINEQLISDGILKPTSIVAVMVNEKVDNPSIYKHWSPAFAVRDPAQPAPSYDSELLLKKIPYNVYSDTQLLDEKRREYSLDTTLLFTNADNFPENSPSGIQYLMYGWCAPEDNYTWSMGETAAFVLPLVEEQAAADNLILELQLISYPSPLHSHNKIEVLVNDTIVEVLQLDNSLPVGQIPVRITIPAAIVKGKKTIEVVFVLPNRRQPQYESGNDLRSLGIGLISAKLRTADLPEGKCVVCGAMNDSWTVREVLNDGLSSLWGLNQEEIAKINLRESSYCVSCMNSSRTRALAKAIMQEVKLPGSRLFKDWVEGANKKNYAVAEINSCGKLHDYLGKLDNLRFSEYRSTSDVIGNSPNENILNLSYPDNSFDLVLHSETLEHVADYKKALAECKRVLKPNGICIYTVPVLTGRLTRKCIDVNESGDFFYLKPPSYHGLSDEFLVFWEFGNDFQELSKSELVYAEPETLNYVFAIRKGQANEQL